MIASSAYGPSAQKELGKVPPWYTHAQGSGVMLLVAVLVYEALVLLVAVAEALVAVALVVVLLITLVLPIEKVVAVAEVLVAVVLCVVLLLTLLLIVVPLVAVPLLSVAVVVVLLVSVPVLSVTVVRVVVVVGTRHTGSVPVYVPDSVQTNSVLAPAKGAWQEMVQLLPTVVPVQLDAYWKPTGSLPSQTTSVHWGRSPSNSSTLLPFRLQSIMFAWPVQPLPQVAKHEAPKGTDKQPLMLKPGAVPLRLLTGSQFIAVQVGAEPWRLPSPMQVKTSVEPSKPAAQP
jgi:hypothetical protein